MALSLWGLRRSENAAGPSWFTSCSCGTDFVGHPGAARAHGLVVAFGGVAGGLVLQLGVDLATYQHDRSRQPQPDREADNATQRAIGGVVAAEIGHVPR